jgi:hypothetical protein
MLDWDDLHPWHHNQHNAEHVPAQATAAGAPSASEVNQLTPQTLPENQLDDWLDQLVESDDWLEELRWQRAWWDNQHWQGPWWENANAAVQDQQWQRAWWENANAAVQDQHWQDAGQGWDNQHNAEQLPAQASAAGDPQPAARIGPRVLMSWEECTQRTHQNFQGLHKAARSILDTATAELTQNPGLPTIDLTVDNRWPTWKAYIATHERRRQIVGAGITSVTAERATLDGSFVKDHNRGGEPRVDIVVESIQSKCRMHPGGRRGGDADLHFSGV